MTVTVTVSGEQLVASQQQKVASLAGVPARIVARDASLWGPNALDRLRDGSLADVREPLARRVERPVTFGWAPRFLHSTGQDHKNGPPIGSFLQITGLVSSDLDIPDRPFTFAGLIAAPATGDAKVLADMGRPVLRLHVTSPEGLAEVTRVLTS